MTYCNTGFLDIQARLLAKQFQFEPVRSIERKLPTPPAVFDGLPRERRSNVSGVHVADRSLRSRHRDTSLHPPDICGWQIRVMQDQVSRHRSGEMGKRVSR